MKILFIPLIDIIKSYFEKYYEISQFLISINLLFILKKKKRKNYKISYISSLYAKREKQFTNNDKMN